MNKTNPIIWGVAGAVIASGLVTLSWLSAEPASSNQLLQNPVAAAAGGFFWGWVAGHAKNWYGARLNRP